MSPRLATVKVLTTVLQEKRSLTEALAATQAEVAPQDFGFVSAMSYGIMRYLVSLEYILGKLMLRPLKAKDMDVQAALLLGLYQLRHSHRPPHACVNETVGLARDLKKEWARGLINGVLRNFQRQKDQLEASIGKEPALKYNQPDWLLNRLQSAYGDNFGTIAETLLEQAPMTLRVNLAQTGRTAYQGLLKEQGIESHATSDLESALTLSAPVDVTVLPGFQEGVCSVQDQSAQWVARLMPLQPGQRILDACSAPGGKGAACLERMKQEIQVDFLDIDAKRQQRTQENLARLKLSGRVLTADLEDLDSWWDGKPYDRIILDAPCSATGVIRRHPDIKFFRRPDDIAKLARLQARLLEKCWSILAPGGFLLYSTCSLLPEENRDIVAEFLGKQGDSEDVALPSISATLQSIPGIQFLPQSGGQDGFYYALLKRTDGQIA